MRKNWPPVFNPFSPTAASKTGVDPVSAKSAVATVPSRLVLGGQTLPIASASSIPLQPVQAKLKPVLQHFAPPIASNLSNSIQRTTGFDIAKLRLAMTPFLWPGGSEPADDYFAEHEEDSEEADTEDAVDEEFDQLPEIVAIQAKLAGSPLLRPLSSISTLQCAKKKQTPAQLLKKTVGVGDAVKRVIRKNPRDWRKRKIAQHIHAGRTYYHFAEQVGQVSRTVRMEGPVLYSNAGRLPTVKTKGKRKADANGHLIAHSFGGPPSFTGNFVAMSAVVNGAGGDWGRMETYIRSRLKQQGIAAYMVTKPNYTGASSQSRPTSIRVSVYFNKSPFKVKFDIPCP